MWRKPSQVTNVFAELCFGIYYNIDTKNIEYPFTSADPLYAEGHTYLRAILITLLEIIEQYKQEVRSGTPPQTAVIRYFKNVAQIFEDESIERFRNGSIREMNNLMLIAHSTLGQTEAGSRENSYGNTLLLFFAAVRMLLGNEKQFFLGKSILSEKPIYKKYKTRLNTSDDITDVLNGLLKYTTDLCTVTEEVVDLFPDPRDIVSRTVAKLEQPPSADVVKSVSRLFEDAYYNQRYLVHQRGVRVKLIGFDDIIELQLVVLPQFEDYLQFLAFFVFKDGKKAPYFINEEVFLTDVDVEERIHLASRDDNIFRNVMYLIASVYHDLVTANEIAVEEPSRQAQDGLPNMPSDSSESYIYIRRTYIDKQGRSVQAEPRKPILNTITREPHHVTGHLRHLPAGQNMSAKHRIELEEFEKTTGLRVIRYIKPGFTFVRPHISPSIEGYDELPRFIKARMQREIRTMIEKAETDKE